ncbi:Transmembrane protein 181 [Homo sapiens] [Rhizoctonia solani]|uniref:Transmembrane protein 181 [Homo sapiens] n=1 Tax=Rhizoctonia solani TaxID=456999 RepID=A0A0K6G569_9AGAM|nr:Transmembrane protein 181 [Homo sapiens] [Rhizoctonia solani]
MGTRGYMAYRYKGKYYRQYIPHSAHPTWLGGDILSWIPRNPVALEEWITSVSSDLKERYDDVLADASWTLGDLWIEWTYVIDFDNRVVTVNGALHFELENMPPLRAKRPNFGLIDYLETNECPLLPEVPNKYLISRSLNFWPNFTFNAEKAQQEYSTLQPTVVIPSEWHRPTWDTLSVSQHLSANLIKTLVYDYSDELALCYYPSIWPKLGVFCWNVANAAATSHLLCPPADAAPQSDMTYILDIDHPTKDKIPGKNSTGHFYLEYKKTMGRFCWFRGCLVTFCTRLDDPAYMTHKVVQMVRHLRRNNRTKGVGIIMSGWHVVAVTVDESDVRHSPVLDLHDGKDLKDGALLLMHLLSPTFTRSKVPWLASLPLQTYEAPAVLPDEVLRHIAYFADFDTYLHLPLVSRYFRSICLAYPRIGNHTLLSYEGTHNSEPMFRVQSTSSLDSHLTILKRIKTSMSKPKKALPLWKYTFKTFYIEPAFNAGLAGMFQCHQTGTGPLAPAPSVPEGTEESQALVYLKPKLFANVALGYKHSNVRVQALDGVWKMVPVDEGLEAESGGVSSEGE